MNLLQFNALSQAASEHGAKQFLAWRQGEMDLALPVEETERFYGRYRETQKPDLPMWEDLTILEREALATAYLSRIPQ